MSILVFKKVSMFPWVILIGYFHDLRFRLDFLEAGAIFIEAIFDHIWYFFSAKHFLWFGLSMRAENLTFY